MVSIMKIWKIILAVLTIVAGIVLFDEAGLVLNKVRLASAFGADVGSIVMYAGYIVSILYIIISILFLVYLNKKDNKGEKIIIVLSIIAFIFSFLGPKLFEDLQFLSFCAILCLITATVSFFNNKKSQSGLADLKQHCPYCGAVLNDDSLFCTKCGKELPKRIACPHCGASMNEGDAFCPNCGKSINEVSAEHSEEQESQQASDVSEKSTSKKYLPIIVGVIVLAILGGGWWSYKSSMEKKNVNLDSLITVNLEEVKEDASYVSEEVIAKEKLEDILKELVGIADGNVILSKVNKFCTEEFKTGFKQACDQADKEGCERPRLWWSYSDDDPEKYEIKEIVMTSDNVAKAEVKLLSEMYIGRFNVVVKKEGDTWLIDKIDEVETLDNPNFNISDNADGSSFKEYSDYVGTWKLNRIESGQKMRIEVKLKENHSGEFVVFLLKGSHDEVLVFENYPKCILSDGVIYLTKNGDITRGDVPKLKAASDGLYSFDNEKYVRDSK